MRPRPIFQLTSLWSTRLLLACWLILGRSAGAAEAGGHETLFPADCGLINVKTCYGAKGDGVTDDTAAIQRAIRENVQADRVGRMLYFPDGVYLVSDRLAWRKAPSAEFPEGRWSCLLGWQGQSRERTILRLKDHCPGYADAGQPRAVIKTGGNGHEYDAEAYRNQLWNFSVDTGKGNPGAIGLDYVATNSGCVREVSVRSGDGAGAFGILSLGAPALLKNVAVEGFDYGIQCGHATPLENVVLSNQKVAGLWPRHTVPVLNLVSHNQVPAIKLPDREAFVVAVGGQLLDGAPEQAAIDNAAGGTLYLRDVACAGYGSLLKGASPPAPVTRAAEYTTYPPRSLFPVSTSRSLHLPIQDQPRFHDNDLSHWANVLDYGANNRDGNDDSDAIQRAIDDAARTGRTTIYFPTGEYVLKKTIRVRGGVRRLLGMGSEINPQPEGIFSDAAAPAPGFRVEETAAPEVFIEHFYNSGTGHPAPGLVWIEHASAKTLVLRDVQFGFGSADCINSQLSYRGLPGAGRLFTEMVAGDRWRFAPGQEVWIRMCNPESHSPQTGSSNWTEKIINDGAKLWILGVQAEQNTTFLRTRRGGWSEVLGANLFEHGFPGRGPARAQPALINEDANVSFVGSVDRWGEFDWAQRKFEVAVEETRDKETRRLARDEQPHRVSTGGVLLNLYVGRPR